MRKYIYNLKLRSRIAIPLLFIMVLLFTAIHIITIYSLKRTFNYNTNKLIEAKIKEVNGKIEQVGNTALYIASISSEMRIVKKAYREYYISGDLQKSSKIIENQFSKINKIILENSGYKARIHFHLPPSISFCRCWSKVRGDDISDFRNSVLKMSKEQTSAKGIETGRGGFVIRGIAPIFSETKKYYGSVEVFFNINILLESIQKKTDEDFAIFMDTVLLKIATNFLEDSSSNIHAENQVINNYIFVDKTEKFQLDNIKKHGLDFNINDKIIFHTNNYKYATIPIKNINNKIEGIGILQINISKQQKALTNVIFYEVIFFIFLLIIVVLVLSKLNNYLVISRIKKADLLLHKLAKGELIEEIEVKQNDEIGNMQTSLNILNKNITKNTNFAIEISKGNLNTNYKALSKADLLGNSIIQMQNELINSKESIDNFIKMLSESEEKFKQLSDLTFEGILIHDKGIAIDCNHSFEKIFGYTLDELIDKNIIKLIIKEEYHGAISKNIIKNYALPYEIEGIKKDGSIIPIEVEARYIKSDITNKIIRVAAIRDITFRKHAEEQIIKLSIAVEQSANTIFIADIDGNIEYVNPKFTELTGYTAQEIIGQKARMLNAKIQPIESYTKIWQTITKGEVWKGEFHNKKKNGDYYWEQVTITPIKENDKIINYLAIKEDITEKREALRIIEKEKMFTENLIETSPGIFFLYEFTNNDAKLIKWNKNHETLLGYTNKDLQSMFTNDFIQTEQLNILAKKLEELKQEKETDIELYLKHKNGDIIPYFLKGIGFREDKKQFFMGIGLDISERKQAEEQIKKDLKIQTTLIQEIYHRTKNNMAVISAMLSMESRRSENDYVKSTFREINNKIYSMSLVHQKLYKAQDLSSINLKDYIEDLIKLINQSYSLLSKKIKIKFDLHDVKVLIDSAIPLGLIINELVSNIFKHAFPKNQEGEIFIRLFKEEDETINLEIIDNGVGFSKNFDPRKDGSMGLVSVFSIVEYQLKGEISVKSENGLRWHIKIKDDKHKERV